MIGSCSFRSATFRGLSSPISTRSSVSNGRLLAIFAGPSLTSISRSIRSSTPSDTRSHHAPELAPRHLDARARTSASNNDGWRWEPSEGCGGLIRCWPVMHAAGSLKPPHRGVNDSQHVLGPLALRALSRRPLATIASACQRGTCRQSSIRHELVIALAISRSRGPDSGAVVSARAPKRPAPLWVCSPSNLNPYAQPPHSERTGIGSGGPRRHGGPRRLGTSLDLSSLIVDSG